MNKLVFIACLIAVVSSFDVDVCTLSIDTGVFYLCPFSQLNGPIVVKGGLGEGNVSFSLVTQQVVNCDATSASIFGVYDSPLGGCQDITTDATPKYALLNPSDPNQGINITFASVDGTDDLNEKTTYSMIVRLGCNVDNDDISKTNFNWTSVTTDNGDGTQNVTYIVAADSKYGCPVISFSKILDFISDNQTVFSVVLGVIGLVLTFFGRKLFKVAIFLIALLLGTIITGSLFFQLTHLGQAAWVLWTVFGVSILLGVVLGVLAVKLEKVGFFCVGGALGVTGGLLLYNAVISPILKGNAGSIPLYITVVVCALIGGIVAFYIFESVLIIATSLIGSYFVVRVISIYAGHFPNEAYVADGLKSFDAVTYAYLGGILVLAIIGMVVQFKTRKAKKEIEEEGGEKQGNYAYYRY